MRHLKGDEMNIEVRHMVELVAALNAHRDNIGYNALSADSAERVVKAFYGMDVHVSLGKDALVSCLAMRNMQRLVGHVRIQIENVDADDDIHMRALLAKRERAFADALVAELLPAEVQPAPKPNPEPALPIDDVETAGTT
jgi:hypothetical protein